MHNASDGKKTKWSGVDIEKENNTKGKKSKINSSITQIYENTYTSEYIRIFVYSYNNNVATPPACHKAQCDEKWGYVAGCQRNTCIFVCMYVCLT